MPAPNSSQTPTEPTVSVGRILTHPGSAHKDDFLACSVLVHRHGAPVVRRDPTDEDLEDTSTLVVDIGGQHQPELGNFDHHQFPRDDDPLCALSLVLKDLGIYDDARRFCDWLEPAEWIDCRGPIDTARHLGVSREVMGQLISPVDLSVMRRFSMATSLGPDDALWQVMRMIGEDLVSYIEGLGRRLNFIHSHAEWWNIEGPHGAFEVLFMPRTDPLPPEPSAGLPRYIEQQGRADSTVAMVYPDRRGDGYALARYNDKPALDCSRLADCDDVHFAHARGFVAKSSATEVHRLKELLSLAQVAATEPAAANA